LASILNRSPLKRNRTISCSSIERKGETAVSDDNKDSNTIDKRWLSSNKLVDPWVPKEHWWIKPNCSSFLDTNSRVFGQRRIFLIEKRSTATRSVGNIVDNT